MSQAQIMDLLHREANAGYGGCMECGHCAGSGLVGGFSGQRSAFGALNSVPLTVAQRKADKAALRRILGKDDKPRKVKTTADRIAAYQAFISRGGPIPKSRAKQYSIEDVRQILGAVEEGKV